MNILIFILNLIFSIFLYITHKILSWYTLCIRHTCHFMKIDYSLFLWPFVNYALTIYLLFVCLLSIFFCLFVCCLCVCYLSFFLGVTCVFVFCFLCFLFLFCVLLVCLSVEYAKIIHWNHCSFFMEPSLPLLLFLSLSLYLSPSPSLPPFLSFFLSFSLSLSLYMVFLCFYMNFEFFFDLKIVESLFISCTFDIILPFLLIDHSSNLMLRFFLTWSFLQSCFVLLYF